MFILTQKHCPKCEQARDVDSFYKDKRTPDGLSGICKSCHNLIVRNARSNQTDEQRLVNNSRAKKRYAENIEKEREKDRKRYAANAEKIKKRKREAYDPEYGRQYYLANKERHYNSTKNWRIANPLKAFLITENRRARKIANGGKITDKEWGELCEKYGNKCLRCGRSDAKITLDHVVPLALGGTNTIDNAQPLCLSCNSSKGARVADYR